MKVDFQFLSLVICSVMGWTLKEVFSLTWPQFIYVASEIQHVQYFKGKNETFFSLCAAFADKTDRKQFLKSAEGFVIQNDQPENLNYTEEDLRAAERRMRDMVKPDAETGKETTGK